MGNNRKEGYRHPYEAKRFALRDGEYKDQTGELPPALIKARLLEGEKWVGLYGLNDLYTGGEDGSIEMSGVDHRFPRGLNVRLSDIVWVADAPDGS